MSKKKKLTIVYGYLTGPDDATFCHRVTEALSNGWTLYGSPTLTFDPSQNRLTCGQAIIKQAEDFDYSPQKKLSEV